jgi:hypothetical protein
LKVPFAVALPSLPNTPLDVFFGAATAALKAAGTDADAAAAADTADAAATASADGMPARHSIGLKATSTCPAAATAVPHSPLSVPPSLLLKLLSSAAQFSAAEQSAARTHPAKLMSDKRSAAGPAWAE